MNQRSPDATCRVGDFPKCFQAAVERTEMTRSSPYSELLSEPFHCLNLGMEQENPNMPQTLEYGPYWESYPAWTTKQKIL